MNASISFRPYETTALGIIGAGKSRRRIAGLYWARRARKSTTLGRLYFRDLSLAPRRVVIGCSASLLLGKELVGMTLTALEQAEILRAEAAALVAGVSSSAEKSSLKLKFANSETGKVYGGALSPEDLTDLYQARKMELRLHFSASDYSRLLILAPNIATFRSYRALIGLDEFPYIPSNLAMDLVQSADAMMRDTPDRQLILAGNLSLGDKHPWFEMTMPGSITAATEEEQFPARPEGHLYYGQTGMLIHRVALKDAYAAGHKLYDDEGVAMSYADCEQSPQMRGGWDVSYGLGHKPGGACVVDLMALLQAMRAGVGKCHFVYVDKYSEFQRAAHLLRSVLGHGRVCLGMDVASTTGETSNPTSISVREDLGGASYADRLVVCFKEKKVAVMRERLGILLDIIEARPKGGKCRKLVIDASNERLAAEETADLLASRVDAELYLGGLTVSPRPAGYAEKDGNVNYKTWTGDMESALLNGGRVLQPTSDYLKKDKRLVVKDSGRYLCTPDPLTGAHGDCFDSGKLAGLGFILDDQSVGNFVPAAGVWGQAIRNRQESTIYA